MAIYPGGCHGCCLAACLGCGKRPAAVEVPQAHGAIVPGRQRALVVGQHRNRIDPALMPLKATQFGAALQVPEVQGAIVRGPPRARTIAVASPKGRLPAIAQNAMRRLSRTASISAALNSSIRLTRRSQGRAV